MTVKFLALAAFGLALSACSGSQLARTEATSPTGSDFDKELYAEYVRLSRQEYQEADYKDSDAFARRAFTAANGETVGPEKLSARRLPEDNVGELTDARARLSAALARGAAQKVPLGAAHAQVAFDCWMQEQEENNQPEDIAACRAAFLTAIVDVEEGMTPQVAAAQPAPEPEPVDMTREFIVFFDFNESKLSDAALATLRTAASYANTVDDAKIALAGHTDRAGDAAFNQSLAVSRADTVAAALRGEGVSGNAISQLAFGENQPAVATVDGAAEASNRRVTIIVGQ